MTTTCPPPNQPSSEAKAGVAIILSPERTIQWKSSKKQKKIMRGEIYFPQSGYKDLELEAFH
jgi:hypothetical protein